MKNLPHDHFLEKGSVYRRTGKRGLDVALVLIAAPVWAPLAVAVAVVVRVTMGRPILYRQRRPGLQGVPFTIYKFRTMTEAQDAQGIPLPDAERMTRVGALLRRLSLDELPQLFSVLRGEMSLVGPRPLLEEYLPYYTDREARRHQARPGITGQAQISGRNHLSWEERLELDVQYVESMSLATDLRILQQTVRKAFSGEGVAVPGTVSRKLSDERRES